MCRGHTRLISSGPGGETQWVEWGLLQAYSTGSDLLQLYHCCGDMSVLRSGVTCYIDVTVIIECVEIRSVESRRDG